MKLSKVLLQAILAGVTVGGASSCELIDSGEAPHKHTDACIEVCTEKQEVEKQNQESCPACGMG